MSSNPNLTLICPSGGLGDPQFGDPRTGKTFSITDPQFKAGGKSLQSTAPGRLQQFGEYCKQP
jgi:hypothetical protein